MAWDFSTEPEFDSKLKWMREFLDDEILPLEALDLPWHQLRMAIAPLQEQVRAQGLWAMHLPAELGGPGYGQIELALMNEILGRCMFAPTVFGCQAPDSGNAELLGLFGTEEQKSRWFQPLLAGELISSFSMTEPGAGADPLLLRTAATEDGDHWVINGHKWFSSNASIADFLIVMARTAPDAEPHRQYSMIIVPIDTPGVNVIRDVKNMGDPGHETGDWNGHAEVVYDNVRVPRKNILGGDGDGFLLAQKRLGPGRIHHCMRWIGQSQRAFDMLCERAVTRRTHGSVLGDKQTVQNWVADCYAEMQAARLMTLHAAWKIDSVGSSAARTEIAAIKYFGAMVLYNVIDRAIQTYGSLGYSSDMPLESMYRHARAARIYDGPDEVHKITVARRVLRNYAPADPPTEHVPTRHAAALQRFADLLETTA
jgi:acyl-CoA dehydrogenase